MGDEECCSTEGCGRYMVNNKCDTCPGGYYQDEALRSSCDDCGENEYSDTDGSSQCKDCPQGRYTSSTRQSACKGCPSGMCGEQGEQGCRTTVDEDLAYTSGEAGIGCNCRSYYDETKDVDNCPEIREWNVA